MNRLSRLTARTSVAGLIALTLAGCGGGVEPDTSLHEAGAGGVRPDAVGAGWTVGATDLSQGRIERPVKLDQLRAVFATVSAEGPFAAPPVQEGLQNISVRPLLLMHSRLAEAPPLVFGPTSCERVQCGVPVEYDLRLTAPSSAAYRLELHVTVGDQHAAWAVERSFSHLAGETVLVDPPLPSGDYLQRLEVQNSIHYDADRLAQLACRALVGGAPCPSSRPSRQGG